MLRCFPIKVLSKYIPYSTKFWWWKILANLAKLCPFAKILHCQNFEIFVNAKHTARTWRMALLKYFKPVNLRTLDESLNLPDLDSSHREVIPSTAIAKANKIVSEVLEQSSSSGEREPYLKLTPAQRYQIGKQAAEHGITTSIHYFKTKFPHLELKETSIRRLKKLYLSELLKGHWRPDAIIKC